MFRFKRAAAGLALTGVSLGAFLLDPMAAQATPPSGVSAKLISEVTIGETKFVIREVTIAPGGSTGWHYHDGPVFGWIKSGTLTHVDSDCTVAIYRPGQPIFEPSGAHHVHMGRNDGSTAVVLDALYVLPTGAPFAKDAADPRCARTSAT